MGIRLRGLARGAPPASRSEARRQQRTFGGNMGVRVALVKPGAQAAPVFAFGGATTGREKAGAPIRGSLYPALLRRSGKPLVLRADALNTGGQCPRHHGLLRRVDYTAASTLRTKSVNNS